MWTLSSVCKEELWRNDDSEASSTCFVSPREEARQLGSRDSRMRISSSAAAEPFKALKEMKSWAIGEKRIPNYVNDAPISANVSSTHILPHIQSPVLLFFPTLTGYSKMRTALITKKNLRVIQPWAQLDPRAHNHRKLAPVSPSLHKYQSQVGPPILVLRWLPGDPKTTSSPIYV